MNWRPQTRRIRVLCPLCSVEVKLDRSAGVSPASQQPPSHTGSKSASDTMFRQRDVLGNGAILIH